MLRIKWTLASVQSDLKASGSELSLDGTSWPSTCSDPPDAAWDRRACCTMSGELLRIDSTTKLWVRDRVGVQWLRTAQSGSLRA